MQTRSRQPLCSICASMHFQWPYNWDHRCTSTRFCCTSSFGWVESFWLTCRWIRQLYQKRQTMSCCITTSWPFWIRRYCRPCHTWNAIVALLRKFGRWWNFCHITIGSFRQREPTDPMLTHSDVPHFRYSLYGRWKNDTFLVHPKLIRRRGAAQKKIKALMKRVSKENVKPVGRSIGKLSHCSPGFLFDYVMRFPFFLDRKSFAEIEKLSVSRRYSFKFKFMTIWLGRSSIRWNI